MDTAEQLRDKVDDPSTSMAPSLQNTDNLQGIYVYQLPFPGTLPEKAQREQLAAVVRKYSKIVEIRFDAVPNNPDVSSVQAGRRYQLPPLSRRALIVFQKIAPASFEGLLAELNKQVMSQCHLNASTAKSEHINALIAMRNAAGHNAAKAHQTMGAKGALQNPTAEQQQQPYSSKRPLTLLKIQPPAPAVKAFAMDSQTHTQPDPFHKNASRTLYVKHLDNTITEEELKVRYGKFGHILDIEVKNRNTMAPYAFIQFTNIESVANAIKAFNQQLEECGARQKKNSNLHWWGNTIVTSRLWIGRLPPNCGEQYLMSKMRVVLTQPDDVTQVIYDANFNEAIVMFVGHESTQIAFNKVKNRNITFQPERSSITEPVHHVHVDFCSEKLHDYFIDRLYGKNTEPLLSDALLAPPPDPPKCLSSSHNQPKKSPSPPPDPSIETIGHCASVSRRSVGRQKLLLIEQQQTQNAAHGFEKVLINYSSAKMGRTVREMTHSNSMGGEETQQSHRERTTRGRSQDNAERGRFANARHTRSISSSSNTSTDTYSQSPRKRWRHPAQPSESNEFSGSRQKNTSKKQSSETKHTWERKHRSQRSTERRRESRVERREKRRERRRSRTRQTTGVARRTEGDRSGETASGDRSKRGIHGGGTTVSGTSKRSRISSKVEKHKNRSKERDHTKTSSNSGCQLLPPPPAPPLRIDKAHDQHKRRRSTTSSSDSHSSCTCSSCTSNSSSNSRTSSLSENSDSELSSSEHEADEERPSTRRNHRSRKDGLIAESCQVGTNPSPVKGEASNVQTVPIQCDPLPLDEAKTVLTTDTLPLNAGRESEKTTTHNEKKEESNITSKDKDRHGDQSQRKDQTTTAKDEPNAPKKTNASSSLPVQPPQPVGKIQVPRPSQRTIVGIPLDVQATPPPCDPRLTLLRQSCGVAEQCLELPRFAHKMRAMACSGDRPSSSIARGEATNLTEESQKTTPTKAVPPSTTDWIKQEPEFNVEIEQSLKIKSEVQNNNEANAGKKPAKADTLNLIASITDRIKCVEKGITELRIVVQPEQILASTNFEQIELEVSRIRTELNSGISLEQLEQLIAQRSVITAQINTSTDAGVGRQLQPKAIGDEETEKNRRNGETEGGGLHDRSCSFVSESDLPARSFSLSCDHHPSTSSVKSLRLPHEKEQFIPIASSCTSPLPKQSSDAGNAFSRRSKHTDSSPNQLQSRNALSAGIPKEIKVDRKSSTISLAITGDPWTMTSVTTSLSSVKKEKEVKIERREHRSDSVGHLPSKEQRKEMGIAKANVHPILKKMPTMAMKTQQKQQPKDERKTDSSVAFSGAGTSSSGSHAEEHKKQLKAKLVENESASDVDRHHKKHKRKKKHADQSSTSTSSSEESLDGSELFTEIDIEEQKRMMEAIKSGVGFGLSMYDRVKRRSSQRPDDEQKKKTALEVLKSKHAKKRKEFARVRLSSTSTDSEGSEGEGARTTAVQAKSETSSSKAKLEEGDEHAISADEDDHQPKREQNNDIMVAEKLSIKQQDVIERSAKNSSELKTNLTIRRPEIAPRKPFMDEPKIREEELNSSASSVEEASVGGSESEHEDDEEMDAGDRAIKKLKNELSRYRKSSESSVEEAKHFNEKLAKVISIAAEGCRTQSGASHSEKGVSSSSSSSNSSSSSESDTESTAERSKSISGMSKKLQSQKKVKHLSMEDVFGADSSEESVEEHTIPPSHSAKVEHSSSAVKLKTIGREKSATPTEKEKAQGLAVNEKGKRTRVSSLSSVSSMEQKRFKEAKSKTNAEKEAVTPSVRDRSKSDATALKKAQLQQQKQPTAMSASDHFGIVRTMTEMDKKMKQKQTKTAIGAKVTIKTAKNLSLAKELAKRKMKSKEGKRLDKATLKRASGADEKDQSAKKAKTELTIKGTNDQNKEKSERVEKEAQRDKEERAQSVQLASDTVQYLGGSSTPKVEETIQIHDDEKMDNEEQQQKEKRGDEEEERENRKKETDELLNMVAAEQMAENEFEIIDSGKVQATETDQIVAGVGETEGTTNKIEEMRDEKEKKKREREEEEEKKMEEEKKSKRDKEEKETNANGVPTEEDDEEAMEAELLRRMEECNEEEAAVASLGLQSRADGIISQVDLNQQQSDDITHLRLTSEKSWDTLEKPSGKVEKQEKITEKVEREDEKEEEKETMEAKNEESVVEETKCEETEEGSILREQPTVAEEPAVDKNAEFRFETVERRASNESVDSHMAGVGNGFVEVDAEHLRQQKREQDALERLAEEKRRTEETVKRMDETVDAVATNSTVLQHHESSALNVQQMPSPNLAQHQQLTMEAFHRTNQQSEQHQATTADAFHQQREGGVVSCDFFYPTNTALDGQTQNQQQQHEVIAQAVPPVNAPLNINIQSQYIQQSQHHQPVHSLPQQHFTLPSTTTEVPMSTNHGTTVCKTPITTAPPSYHPPLMPTASSVVHHQQQQPSFHHYGHLQQHQLPQQQNLQHQPQQQQFPQQQQQLPQQPQHTAHNLQQKQLVSNVIHQQGMANVFAGVVQNPQDKTHQQQQPQQTMASPMIMQQRKLSDIKQQQHQHPPIASTIGQTIQQNPIVQNQQQLLTDRRVDVQAQQLHNLQQHQQQQCQLEQAQAQQRQQFQMQHIVQAPPVVHQQQQNQLPSTVAATSVHNQLPQRVLQQTKQQNAPQRQRKAQTQQLPTTSTQQQQKQFNVSGQFVQQQEQQHHFQPQQLQSDTLSAMSTTGLMDHQSLVSLYQHLRDQQMLHQAQQMPSISAAVIAAASATNQFSPATLSKWQSIVAPPSTMAQGGAALEELLRRGLLTPQTSSFVPSSAARAESAGTSAAVPTSFDELFQQKLSDNSSSPRGLPQHHQQIHQQIISNVPQRTLANTNVMQPQQQSSQQPQRQQNLLTSGGPARYKQIHPVQQQPQHVPSLQQPSLLGQSSERLQQQHQQQQQVQHEQMQQHNVHQQQHPQISQQQQQHHVHANEALQPPPQNVLPSAEQQQQQLHVAQQNQPKTTVKKPSSANKYPVLWQGQLAMKNADTLVQMHKVCGNESLIQQLNVELSSVNENGIPLLRINQRMRLEQTHLENLIRKMEREDNQLALICLPCGRDRKDVENQTLRMNIAFIEYFSSKSAAGIVSSGPTQQPSAMVAHIFPPSDFSRMLLSRNAPDLLRTVESLNAGYLFVILTNK